MNIAQLMTADVVTVDIWDTVLRRTCHPEALKRYAAGCLVDALDLKDHSVRSVHLTRLAIEASLAKSSSSGEFCLESVISAWVKTYRPGLPPEEHERVTTAILTAECAKELEVTYVDAESAALLRKLPRKPWYLSDYYCGANHIEALLEKVGLRDVFAGGLVSCEVDASKRQGSLFDVARKKWSLSGNWVHFGDHPHSDVAQAQRHGITGLLWTTAESPLLPAKARQFHARTVVGCLDWGAGSLNAQDTPWVFGQKLAPMLAGYSRYVAEVAQTHQAQAIMFLAREGIFLSHVFAALEHTPFSVLDVSRRATFAASLTSDPLAGLQKMWSQYGSQSPAAFCMTLNAPRDVFEPLFNAGGFDWDVPIDQIAAHPGMRSLLESPAFSSAFTSHLEHERVALAGYLRAQLGEEPQPGKTYVVADVGWKGTIQDNLARMYPESKWVGVYCGLVPVTQTANNVKLGYIVDGSRDADWPQYLKQTLPFELMFNASQGSTTGYALDEAGRWAPVYDYIPGESVVHFGFTQAVQEGCLAALDNLEKELHRQAVSPAEVREVARGLWQAVQEAPPSCLVDAAYQLEHNESFGVGGAVTFRRDLSWRELIAALRCKDTRFAVKGWLERMPWRRVVLKQKGTSLATKTALVLYELRQRIH